MLALGSMETGLWENRAALGRITRDADMCPVWAARILDMMHRDGIIGLRMESKPREVLKRPEWLRELDHV